MSTYSTNLGLELIGTGEQSGTWGNTTNTNLGTLIEQAISGYVQYACTGGTDTITIPNGASGVARNMYLELTGTGGGTLVVPANKKLYFIYNSTASAITVKVLGQTGVSVPAGIKTLLVCNGTDVVNALNYIASITLGTALPITSGGTAATTASGARTNLDVPSTTGSGASGTWGINVSGNSATVTNGVYTSGSYSNPSWITALAGSKISGNISGSAAGLTSTLAIASGGTGATSASGARSALDVPSTGGSGASGTWGINISGNAATVTNGVYNNGGTYSINITGNAATVTNGITTGNIGSYAPGLTGSGASGTWGISITGNANYANSAGSASSASTASTASTASYATSAGAVAIGGITGVSQSQAAAGYVVLPGGIKIQWGTFSASPSGVYNSFPTGFSAVYSVTANNNNQDNPPCPAIVYVDNGGFTAQVYSGTPGGYYMAIGV